MVSLMAVSTYAKSNKNEAVAEAFSQLQEKESGRYTGELSTGAKVLGKFLKSRRKA